MIEDNVRENLQEIKSKEWYECLGVFDLKRKDMGNLLS